MAKRQSAPTEIERNIYFYRIAHFDSVRFALPGDLQRIANLPFNEAGRYHVDRNEGDRLIVWPDSVQYPLRLRFGRTRLSNLPSIEKEGHLRPITLEKDEGLSERCHVIIFEDGTVAAEFNFDGPRLNQLGQYLFVKRQAIDTQLAFNPLLQHDIADVISRMSGIIHLRIAGPPSANSRLAQADESLGAAYSSLVNAGATKTVEMSLQPKKEDRHRLLSLVQRLLSQSIANRSDGTALKKLKVRGVNVDSGKIDSVDLLEDHLIASRYFERESSRSKSVRSEDAYEKIEGAYRNLLPDLQLAAAALPIW